MHTQNYTIKRDIVVLIKQQQIKKKKKNSDFKYATYIIHTLII